MNDMAVEFKRRLFTVAEYHQLAEAGILGENDGVELIDGELIEVPPIGPQHISLHARITYYLIDALRGRGTVLPMGSFPLGDRNEPQPDIAVFPYDRDTYARRPYPPPNEFVAFVEIAASSFAFDSRVKMRLYAMHGIPDYLLVDVRRNRLLAYRDPGPTGYATLRDLGYGDAFSLALVPDVALGADAFLDIRDE